ncbi:MAG: cryptochrome/photolyase family protein [Spirochaetaceae bacterium]|nr:cryptochrome/photolyase family protein [Myxococcales bacterium]MCB9725567.1 cryptochrome/photolyase family protein [Spirochaetaceae bacterium]
MSAFRRRLAAASPPRTSGSDRRWLFVPYDQLTDAVGPLATEPPERLGIVLVETTWKPRQRAYHKQKLAMVLASLRHFALEQAARGVAIDHRVGEQSYGALLREVVRERGPLRMMKAAEYELRTDLAGLVAEGGIDVLPNETWLTTRAQFDATFPDGPPWRMDRFYRRVRRDSGILMEAGKPVGGRLSFDAENRRPWRGEPPAPTPPTLPVDDVKQEVARLVEERFAEHPGRLDVASLPSSREDAERLWRWALEECLPAFGPYEDAMSTASRGLFHTRASALLNNGRLLPRRVIDDVLARDLPLPSQEGFVRQVLGWRELVRHVHEQTDGFRTLAPSGRPNHLEARDPLPPAFWGEPSGLHCLDHVVSDVWETGYGHHITRLMVLSNLATLLGVDPEALSDWFWIAYVDAYDWVVEPNVLGMGTYALGDLFVTKPYVSGAAYIHRMSDYCDGCAFDPKSSCPITPLYWDFLARHRDRLAGNPRLAMPLRSLERRSAARRKDDSETARWIRERLQAGEVARPEDRP